MDIGYNHIFNNEFYTEYVNSRAVQQRTNSNIHSNNECNKGTFKQKNRMPYNHWRKQRICGNRCLDIFGNPITNQVIFKDPLALSVNKPNICNIRDNKWRIRYTESQRIQREKNRKNFMSSSTLLEKRNRNYRIVTKTYEEIKNRSDYIETKTVIKHNNPKFLQTGAVSSRNRIAALKNGNKHNNIYNKRCDTIKAWNKTNVVVKKQCKPYHYGGQMGTSLLRCPPKN
jgi:hypothetical protein